MSYPTETAAERGHAPSPPRQDLGGCGPASVETNPGALPCVPWVIPSLGWIPRSAVPLHGEKHDARLRCEGLWARVRLRSADGSAQVLAPHARSTGLAHPGA